MYTFFLLSFVNVWTTIIIGVTDTKFHENCETNTNTRQIGSWVISGLYQVRIMFQELIDAMIMFEWIALLMLVLREKYFTAPELLV